MRKALFLFIILSCIQFSFSQEKEHDSIKNIIEIYTKRDSIRVKNLIEYTRFTTVHNDNESESIIEEAIAICKEINYQDGLGSSYSAYSKYFVRKGLYSEALVYAEKAKKIQRKLNDELGLIITNNNIANVYNQLNQSKKAIEINLESLELLKDQPKSPQKAGIHFYLANAYQEFEEYDNAEYHYNEAKKIAALTNFKTGIAIANSALGTLKIRKKEYRKGIVYLEESLIFFKENNQQANIAHSYIEIASALSKLNHINKAIFYNDKAISIYKKQENLKNLKTAYLYQSEYLERNKKYEKANFYLKQHYKIKDTIFSNDNVKIIKEMQTKYETEKIKNEKEVAEKEVVITKLESKKNKNLLIASIAIGSLLLLSSLFYSSRMKSKKKAEIITLELKETQKRLALEKQYKDSELKALKAQMNPHFIFNALNSIQEYILLNKKNLASDYLGKFADLIRNYLHYSNTGLISIAEEVKNLNLYLELEKLRFEDDLNYTIVVADDVNSDILQIPTMIVQPYVENALKHGLLHKKTERKLNISIKKVSNQIIECVVQDNGIGREKSKLINANSNKTHKSFALKATSERLELLNFGKDKKIGVEIKDVLNKNNEVTGTKVVLKIPITKHI